MTRYGVHGSALPGFRTSAVFSAMVGTHSACTPGELRAARRPASAARDEADRVAPRLADARVEDVEVEAARETGDARLDAGEHAADLLHVAAAHDVRQAGGRGRAGGRSPRATAPRRRGQRVVHEELGRAARISTSCARRERRERGAHRGLLLLAQVAADEAGVGLAQAHDGSFVRKVGNAASRHAAVRLAAAQDRQVQHAQYTPFHDRRPEARERPDVAHAVPRVQVARRLALGLVALQEARHEELLVSVVRRTRPVFPYSTTRSGWSGSTTSIIARGAGG
jgi:hypothetical protein